MKPLLKWGLAAVLMHSAPALAENFAAPLRCKPSQTYLEVMNTSAEAQAFWFQAIGSSPFREKFHEVAAKSTATFALADDYTEETTAIAIKAMTPGLQFKTICKGTRDSSKMHSLRSPWKSVQLPPTFTDRTLKLNLVNLSQAKNPVEILWAGKPLAHTTMPPEFANHELSIAIPGGAGAVGHLELRAKSAFTIKVFDTALVEFAVTEDTQILDEIPASPVRYFEFRSPNQEESFVVPMTDTLLINQSLEQIQNPDRARLFVARIEPASAQSTPNTNRNLVSPTKNPWSWTVVEAQNYADFAHISCDGTPSVVEERIGDWMKNTGGTICFWNYRVHREVPPEEIKQSPLSSRPARPTLRHKH